MALSWLLLIFDRLGWRRKKEQLAEASQLSVTSVSTLCHMRNDGISACEGRVQPLWTRGLFWFDWTSWDLMERSSNCSVVAEIWLVSSRDLQLLGFMCGLA